MSPKRERPLASGRKALVTFRLFSKTIRLLNGTPFGTLMRTNAVPPLTVSGLEERTVILIGPLLSANAATGKPAMRAATTTIKKRASGLTPTLDAHD
jgi:hypothetical protein